MPGYDVHILHGDGDRCEPGEEGVVCLRLPLPPGTLPTLWNDDARYQASYLCEHPGYYLTGDGGYLDGDGYLFVMGRVDDVIDVAGHRLSTGAIESVLATHPAVAECAVIGVADEDQGPGSARPGGAEGRRIGRRPGRRPGEVRPGRDRSGGVFQLVDVVAALPKTRSGKILRKTMRGIAHGKDEPMPSTIEDPPAPRITADSAARRLRVRDGHRLRCGVIRIAGSARIAVSRIGGPGRRVHRGRVCAADRPRPVAR